MSPISAGNASRGLLVAERFGPTFQGEGPSAGQQALFIRLSTCNLSCSWCDTPYTWDWTRFDRRVERRRVSAGELLAWALERDTTLVVVTGGEPLIQQAGLAPLVSTLAEAGRRVEIETNGTIPPAAELSAAVERFNVSPKLSGSGLPEGRRLIPEALQAFAASGKALFKFVVTTAEELEEVAELEASYGLAPVWVMPEGTSEHAVLAGMRVLAEEALARGWSLSSRMHVLLWGDTRGR